MEVVCLQTRTDVNLSTMSAADPVAQSTSVANLTNVGPVGSSHMPIQGSMPFIPSAVYTLPGLPPPVPSMPSVPSYSRSLTDDDVERTATKVQSIISHEIEALVTLKVVARMESVENELSDHFKASAIREIDNTKAKLDDQEQYSRRMCLRISGVDESANEATDKIVLDLAQVMKVDLKITDFDRCHRVGV